MEQAQRVNVWDLSDWSVRTFRLNGFPGGAAFDGELLHVNLASAAAPLDGAAMHVYSLDGELVDSYGERLRPELFGPITSLTTTESARLRTYGFTRITMSPTGRVYEAMVMWPSLRAFEDGELVWHRWFDMAWLEGERIAEIFNRPRSLFDRLTLANLDDDHDLLPVMTLSIAASKKSVVALLGGSYAQVYSAEGVPGKTYKLFAPGADPEGSQRIGQTGWRMAVSQDGSRLCVAEVRYARVLCYTLPEDSTESVVAAR